METRDDDLKKDDADHSVENPQSDLTLVLDNKRLLAVFFGLILVCGMFFIFGFFEGRRGPRMEKNSPASALSPAKKSPPKEFLDPECNEPFSPYPNSLFRDFADEKSDQPQPTEAQMALIRNLLRVDTRIFSMLRVDAYPPLVFVLHQPQPRRSHDAELTMFKFRGKKADSEDLGSFCFIPDFLIDLSGRAIAGWAENRTGGNAWLSSSLKTMVIEKGEVLFPEIESDPFQVAKDLILDQGVAVLITLDSRFEFWEGLNHASSPIQQSIFELNKDGVWVNAASRHLRLVEEWIQSDLKMLKEARSGDDENEIGAAALNLYLDAETAGQVRRFRKVARQALADIGWSHFVERIDRANRNKCRLIETPDPPNGSDKPAVKLCRVALKNSPEARIETVTNPPIEHRCSPAARANWN